MLSVLKGHLYDPKDDCLNANEVSQLLHFCCAANASPVRKRFQVPIKRIIQDFTCLPASLGKAALTFTLPLIPCLRTTLPTDPVKRHNQPFGSLVRQR